MKYLSICSGIEAATCAWDRLGWTPVAFAEKDAFPSAVLAHHYPDVPNLGDLTKYRDWPMELLAEVDLLVGGTPCQSFSVAGARGSLTDERGNLTLIYAHLLDRIDEARALHGRPPALCLWENVPGVLNTADNALGCFLGLLAGEDEALTPPGGRWTDAGYVRGPGRAIAWRCLAAQYFGLAQRRKRVFVVAGAGAVRVEEILFESEGLRRDSPPCRGTGEGIAGTLEASVGSRGYKDNGDGSANLIPEELCKQPYEVANCLTRRMHKEINTTLDEGQTPVISFSARERGDDGRGYDRPPQVFEGPVGAIDTVKPHCVAYATSGEGYWREGLGPLRAREQDSHENLIAFSAKDHGADAGEIAPTLRSMGHDGSHANGGGQVAVAYDTTQITSAANRSNPQPGDPCHPLAAGAHPPLLVGTQAGQAAEDTLFCFHGTQDPCDGGDLAFALGRNSGQENAVAFKPSHYTRDKDGKPSEIAAPLSAESDKGDQEQVIHTGMAVRRLTPRECERLQGFPDDYTLIPSAFLTKLGIKADPDNLKHWAADGPRYKALGNSMAVPCMLWLGVQIQTQQNRSKAKIPAVSS